MNQTDTFQHYQVLRREDGSLWELGRGAMGVTYKAFDINLRCPVALKVINSAYLNHPVARQRFIREARAAAQLRHRNIASVYHLGMDEQHFFYAMEFIDGETLDSLVRRNGPLPVAVALRVAIQAARALNAAARRRLLHRDIKPANLMIVDDEEEADGEGHLLVKIIDFGLARSFVHGDLSTQLTVSGFVGTPQFASPEQLEEKDLDARSDIYSLGITLWFLLAGRPPFTGTLTNLVAQHLTKSPPWEQLGNAPEPVCKLLGRMLQKDPARRPQSPGELRREIEACLKTVTTGEEFVEAAEDLRAEDLRWSEVVASTRAQRGEALGVGTVIANRYQLSRLMGEGNAGRVYQAHDILSGSRRLVAVKVFNREVIITPQDYEALAADVALVRRARHPNLLEVFSLERCADHACVMMEWGGGVTLSDVLRSRGIVTLGEALLLLKQAAIIADHASAHDLRRLELGMHQVMVVSTADTECGMDSQAIAGLLAAKSPLLALKVDALGAARDTGDLATWAGRITLTPQRLLNRDTRSSIEGLVEGTYTHALALLFYELVNGAPPVTIYATAAGEAEYLPLPVLGEAGNAVLRRALSANPNFASNEEFFAAMEGALSSPDPRGAGKSTSAAVAAPASFAASNTDIPSVLIAGDFQFAGSNDQRRTQTRTEAAGENEQARLDHAFAVQTADTRAKTSFPSLRPAVEKASGSLEKEIVTVSSRRKRLRIFAAILLVAAVTSVGAFAIFRSSLAKDPKEPSVAAHQASVATPTLATPNNAAVEPTQNSAPATLEVAAITKRPEISYLLNPANLLLNDADSNGRLDVQGDEQPTAVPPSAMTADAALLCPKSLMASWLQVSYLLDQETQDNELAREAQATRSNALNKSVQAGAQATKGATSQRTRSKSRRPAPQPNFWQRLFGIRPAGRQK